MAQSGSREKSSPLLDPSVCLFVAGAVVSKVVGLGASVVEPIPVVGHGLYPHYPDAMGDLNLLRLLGATLACWMVLRSNPLSVRFA